MPAPHWSAPRPALGHEHDHEHDHEALRGADQCGAGTVAYGKSNHTTIKYVRGEKEERKTGSRTKKWDKRTGTSRKRDKEGWDEEDERTRRTAMRTKSTRKRRTRRTEKHIALIN